MDKKTKGLVDKAVKEIADEIYDDITDMISTRMSNHGKLFSLLNVSEDSDEDETMIVYNMIEKALAEKLK